MPRYETLSNSNRDQLLIELSNKIDEGYAPHSEVFMDRAADIYKVIIKNLNEPEIINSKINVGERVTLLANNLTDKTSWYADSTKVTDESLGTGDGTTVEFGLQNQFIIDVTHGKITGEDQLVSPDGGSYAPEVKIDGITQNERPFGSSSGGDYVINYRNGSITFESAPPSGASITCTYYYSPPDSGSSTYVSPNDGKKLILTTAECMITADVILTDAVIAAVWAYNPNDPPNKIEIEAQRGVYKTIKDLINITNGSLPVVPAIGGSSVSGGNERGSDNDIIQLRWEYSSPIELLSSQGAEIRVYTANHKELQGEHVSFTFYGYETDE